MLCGSAVDLLPCFKSVVTLGAFSVTFAIPHCLKGMCLMKLLEIIDLYKQEVTFFFLADLAQKYAGLESEPELPDLMNEVASKVSTKWKDISIQLGLTLNDQKYFMELTLGDPKQCFTFVFTVWKNRVTRPYKWSTVIQALESPAVDEKRLAQELRAKLQS